MVTSRLIKACLLGTAVLALSGCGIASLPGNYTPMEKQTVQELNGSNFAPEAAQAREAIKTQSLFAQAAFWGREYDLNPADLEAATNLASTVRRMGNPGRAIEIVQHTRALYPRDINLMAEMGAAYISDNKPRPAIKILDTALAQSPQTARLWSLKGAALDQLELFDQARQHYSNALQIKPNDPSTLANVGLSYALEGDPQTAEIWLRRAAAIPGANSNVRQNLALVLGLQNKFDEAERWAKQDLNAKGAANNLDYIRSLRGTSTPQKTVAAAPLPTAALPRAPQRTAPMPQTQKPNSYRPRTYGQAQQQPQTQQKPPQARPQQQAPQQRTAPAVRSSAIAKPMLGASMMVYESKGQSGGPTNAREALLAAARAREANGTAQPSYTRPAPYKQPAASPQAPAQMRQQMPPRRQAPMRALPQAQTPTQTGAPTNVLGQISQNNRPKRAVAQAQQTQLAERARQAQMAQQAQMQQGRPPQGQYQRQYPQGAYQQGQYQGQMQQRPNYGPQPQYGAPYPVPGYAQQQGQPQQAVRPPARTRRR